jgi:hypothetical protein
MCRALSFRSCGQLVRQDAEPPVRARVQCPHDTPLWANVEGKVYRVGEVRARAILPGRARREGGFTVIVEGERPLFDDPGLDPPRSRGTAAELYVPADVEGCRQL